jgi:hypothetical protein
MNFLRKIFLKKLNFSPKLFKIQKSVFSSHFVNHRETPDNNENTPFDFTEENYKKVKEIMVNSL